MKLIEKATNALKKDYVCDHCLGRIYANLLSGLTDEGRGKTIRHFIAMSIDAGEKIDIDPTNLHGIMFHSSKVATKKHGKCSVCKDIFNELPSWAEIIINQLKKYEFDTFLIGCMLPSDLRKREQKFLETVGIDWCEPMKAEITRIIGKEIESVTEKNAQMRNPDITVIIDFSKKKLTIDPRSVFVLGKYQKLARGIPQTRWDCRHCEGKGCKYCKGKGKMYRTSIQEIIEKPFLKQTKTEESSFHGAGREDIDARCLGWRPFVIELCNPMKRKIDLRKCRQVVNKSKKVKVKDLKLADKIVIRDVKSANYDKSYRAEVTFEKEVKALSKLKELNGYVIRQRTPKRVAHRRADKIRRRKVFSIKSRKLSKRKAVFTIKAQAGTYIKELITSDEGRTRPSIADTLNNKVKNIKLDVIKIHSD